MLEKPEVPATALRGPVAAQARLSRARYHGAQGLRGRRRPRAVHAGPADQAGPGRSRRERALVKHAGRLGRDARTDPVLELSLTGRLFGLGPEMPLVNKYDTHAIVRDMRDSLANALTRSMDVKAGSKTTADKLFSTSETRAHDQSCVRRVIKVEAPGATRRGLPYWRPRALTTPARKRAGPFRGYGHSHCSWPTGISASAETVTWR